MYKYKKENEIILNVFPNISEYYNFVKNTPRRRGAEKSSETNEKYFAGTDTLEEAYDLLLNTDDELYREFKEMKKIDVSKILGNVINRKSYKNDVVGFVPNVPNFIKGIPTNMINEVPKRLSQKILNIFLNIDCSAFVDKESMKEAGLKYVQIIDLLEKSGYRCNLYTGASVCGNSNERGFCYIKIKTDREPFNIKKSIFPLAHPAMFRRTIFKWLECADFSYDLTHNGYGRPETNAKITKEYLEKLLKMNLMVWNFQDVKGVNIENILENLKKEYGIVID